MLGGGGGGKTLADFPHEVLLWFLKDKTIADFFPKLSGGSGRPELLPVFVENVLGLEGQDSRRFFLTFCWGFLRDKTIAVFSLKLSGGSGRPEFLPFFC